MPLKSPVQRFASHADINLAGVPSVYGVHKGGEEALLLYANGEMTVTCVQHSFTGAGTNGSDHEQDEQIIRDRRRAPTEIEFHESSCLHLLPASNHRELAQQLVSESNIPVDTLMGLFASIGWLAPTRASHSP